MLSASRTGSRPGFAPRKMRFLPLVAATYFMVSGGPYAIEDILGGAGFATRDHHSARSAVPLESAHRADDRRTGQRHSRRRRILYLGPARAGSILGLSGRLAFALGQRLRHGHLSRLFCDLPGQIQPRADRWLAWIRLVAGGGRAVLRLESARRAARWAKARCGCSALLLAPFAVFVVLGFWQGFTAHPGSALERACSSERGLSTAVLVAMWNYMGWDNASTVAQEVENPQRTYPRAMIVSTLLVAVIYVLPLAAMAVAGLSVDSFSTGDWMTAAHPHRWTAAGLCHRCRRRDHRRRHVQRAGDELLAAAHGHGRRRHAAARDRPAQ